MSNIKNHTTFPVGTHISQTLYEENPALDNTLAWDITATRIDNALKHMTLEAIHTSRTQLALTKRAFNIAITGRPPQDCVTFGLIVNDAQCVSKFARMDEAHIFAADDTQHFEWMTLDPTDMLTVSIEKDYFHERYAAHFGKPFHLPLHANLFACTKEITEITRNALLSLLKNTLKNPPHQELDAYNTALEEDIIGILLPMLAQSNVKITVHKPHLVAYDLQKFMHENYAEDLTIDTMCDVLRISRRNGHLAFKNLYGITPKAYVTRIRLGKVFEALFHGQVESTQVQEVAHRHGFTHMSHFSQNYKNFFGELPSQTLLRSPVIPQNTLTPYRSYVDITHFYSQMFDLVSEGIMLTSLEGEILAVNAAFTHITGYSSSDVVGKKASILRSGVERESFFKTLWHALNTQHQWHGEIHNLNKAGAIIVEKLSIFGIFDDGQCTHYMAIYSDTSEHRRLTDRLEHITRHDPLTGLTNRFAFYKIINQALGDAQNQGHSAALIIMNIDRFKEINDSYGHAIGDELLITITHILQERLNIPHALARINGDEFAILLHHISHMEYAGIVAQDLLETFSSPCKLSNNTEVLISMSMGIAIYPTHGMTAMELMQAASTALVNTKKTRTAAFSYYTDVMTTDALRRIEYERGLRLGVENNAFTLLYQPQVDIKTGHITAVEALLRWYDPIFGHVSPIEFIPIAEASGIIHAIGKWVLFQACVQAKKWLDKGTPIKVAVNISVKQFETPNFEESVDYVLHYTKLPPHLLELELTESLFLANPQEMLASLERIKAKGITLSIDDFGTGYSSLAYLKKLPVHVLKIDKSFIDGITHTQADRQIASSIIALAHIMGLHVLAEGVETKAQLEFLMTQSCDSYQGYYKAQPLTAQAITDLLNQTTKE